MDREHDEKLKAKDSRWDRIRKRHIKTFDVRSEIVEKFLKIDFISNKHIKMLNGDISEKKLDPLLVMDLRHEMIYRVPKSTKKMNGYKELSLEKVKQHNLNVEEHYIKNEISKIQANIAKSRPKSNTKLKTTLKIDNYCISDNLYNKNEIFIDNPKEITNDSCNNKILIQNQQNISLIQENGSINETQNLESFISEYVNEIVVKIEAELENELNIHKESIENNVLTKNLINTLNFEQENDIVVNKNNVISNDHKQLLDESCCLEECFKPSLSSDYNENINAPQSSIKEVSDSENNNQKNSLNHKEFIVPLDRNCSEQDENVISNLIKVDSPNINILSKYFSKWTYFTTAEKIEKNNFRSKNERIQKINSFLEQIRKEKHKIQNKKPEEIEIGKHNSIILAKQYQNKIKIQKDIIDLQKVKLERQERMIIELKLSKLSEENYKAKQDLKTELKQIVRNGETKLRSKAKCLQITANLRDSEDEKYEHIQGKSLLNRNFLENMNTRAMERAIRHEQAQQRRIKLEQEKEAAKKAAEEAKRLEDEESKRKRIEALREKHRQEKLAKLQKQKDRELWIAHNKKAEKFYKFKLLKNIGLRAFKILIILKKDNYLKAKNFYEKKKLKKIFTLWKIYTQNIWNSKIICAEKLKFKIYTKYAFCMWKLYYNFAKSKYNVAIDWYDLKISEKILQHWIGYVKLESLIQETKLKQAESHYNWHMKWKILDHWQRLPQVLKIEKETERRRLKWRMKIWELLPDYTPNRGGDEF